MEQDEALRMIAEHCAPDVAEAVVLAAGTSECRSWLEAEVAPGGGLRLVGMCSRTDYDQSGRVVYHKTEPTGMVSHYPSDFNTKPGWIERILGV